MKSALLLLTLLIIPVTLSAAAPLATTRVSPSEAATPEHAAAKVDWAAFRVDFKTYVALPSAENADAVASHLPASGHVELTNARIENDTLEFIYEHLDVIESEIMERDEHAMRLAERLKAIADGAFAEELADIIFTIQQSGVPVCDTQASKASMAESDALMIAAKHFAYAPNPENAQAVLSRLDIVLRNLNMVAVDEEAVQDALAVLDRRSRALEQQILAREPNAVRLALRLRESWYFASNRKLDAMLGRLIRIDPRFFLRSLVANDVKVDCVLVSTLDPVYEGRPLAERREMKLRISALKSVSDPDLTRVRDECLRLSEESCLASEETVYVVKRGDSLWKIADRFYGDGTEFRLIAEANKDALLPSTGLRVGMKLRIPSLPRSSDSAQQVP